MEREKDASLGPIDTDTTLWVMIPQLIISVVLVAVIVTAVFWLTFGEIALFDLGFIMFLSAMQVLMVIGYRFRNRSEYHATKKANFGLLDKIGGFWLVACAFGAFFAWVCGSLAVAFPSIRTAMYVAAGVFAIGFPVVTMLPNVRYVGGRAPYVQIPLLVIITMLPVLEGTYYVHKLFR